MAKIDTFKLRKNVTGLEKFRSAAFNLVEDRVNKEGEVFLNSFSNHPVTTEIDAGESALNSSGTLGGYGNLFSFIGFASGSNPTQVVKDMIKKIKLLKKPYYLRKTYVSFKVLIPTKVDFESACTMPWAMGRSWLAGIEKGISGFGYYLSKKMGRSGGGVQADSQVRQGSF